MIVLVLMSTTMAHAEDIEPSRNYKFVTKTISTLGTVEREDHTEYKGLRGRLYLIEDSTWNNIVIRISHGAEIVAETADWLEEKARCWLIPCGLFIPSILSISGTHPSPKYQLLFVPRADESMIKLVNQGIPLSVANKLFNHIDRYGKLPYESEWK